MKKLLMVVLAGMLVVSCTHGKKEKGITVTDAAGRQVEVPENPSRVVAIGPGGLRMLVYLGVQDKVVGVEGFEKKDFKGRVYRYVFTGAEKLPVIAPGGPKMINTEPDIEAVLKVKAQVIFAAHMTKETADKVQKKSGIPVVVVTYGPRFATLTEEFFTSLNVIAAIMKKKERAEEIKKFYNTTLADLQKRVPEGNKPLAYIGGVGYRGAQGITSTDPMYLPFVFLKANNYAFKYHKTEHVFIDREKLLGEQPEIMFVDGLSLVNIKKEYEKTPDFYHSLKAVKNGKIYNMPPFNFYTTNLGTALIASYAAGKILHPESYKDIDIRKKGDEIYAFLLGKSPYEQIVKDFGEPGSPVKLK